MKNVSEGRESRMPIQPGSMDRGPLEFHSRAAKRTGDIMAVATHEVVTVPPTTTIMSAIKTMTYYGFNRLPVTDPGTKRLLGFVSSVDMVDFLGGGIRHKLLREKFDGNIFVGINADLREIMSTKLVYARDKDSIEDALQVMYTRNVGGLPIVDDQDRIKAIVTEEDFVHLIAGVKTGIPVEAFMSSSVVTAPAQMSIEKTTKMIVQKGFRRLPTFQDGVLIGMVTAFDIMRYLGSGEAFKRVITGHIQEVMEQPVKILIARDLITIEREADLGNAAQKMVDRGIGSLPVMDGGSLVGILTERDFIRAVSENRSIIS
jgi:CBS domain-containing protein